MSGASWLWVKPQLRLTVLHRYHIRWPALAISIELSTLTHWVCPGMTQEEDTGLEIVNGGPL